MNQYHKKTLYIDCSMGAAGDMLTAALSELLPDQDAFIDEMNHLGIPGIRMEKSKTAKCGIHGTHITVKVHGQEEESLDVHAHHHEHEEHQEHGHHHIHEHERHEHEDHEHTHHHSSMHEIEHIIRELLLPQKVQADVLAVYQIIAEAESHVHGVPVTDIHFHEVGTMDAIADITAVCLLIYKLAPEQIIVSPIHVGSGQVRCAHGILPVPAPATAYILRDIPIYSGTIKGELCTPTGAALLKHFASQFGSMPVMITKSIGYGMGNKDFEAANCVRASFGLAEDHDNLVAELCCNIDDMTPEAIGFAMERLFDAGALEVYTVPVGMKKSRPGILLCVMCKDSDRESMISLMMKHTTTIGIRENISHRYTMNRKTLNIDTPLGSVRQKQSEGYGVIKTKYEYEDLARIAREKNLSLAEVLNQIL
ncbi:MAG: nickel pincer cofactor biosynthesis protein LarC [bacterium]|nr:nickel pincer cofactor biosynthesis protein LarC [bacterium]